MAITRRNLLIGLGVAGGAAIAGGSIIPSLLGGDEESGGGITLTFPTATASVNFPWARMPDQAQRREFAWARAYYDVVNDWLAEHPGIRLRWIEVDPWNQEALVTAVSGGSGPAIFPGLVLGNWNMQLAQRAFAQGMAADITDLMAQHDIKGKLTDLVEDADVDNWEVRGRQYAMPDGYDVGNGIYFRRDLIQELGLEEPTPGYDWADLRELARGLTDGDRKGAAFQAWGVGWILGADGFDMLTKIPAPGEAWHWRYDYTTHADTWAADIERYRAMVYEDESVLSDITITDQEAQAAFAQGRACIFGSNAGFFVADADQENRIGHLAKQLDRPIGEIIGFVQHPRGRHGQAGITSPWMSIVSFSPDLETEALEQAFALQEYMQFGEGWTKLKLAAWEESHDLQKVYTTATPINGVTQIEGIPGSFEDAWGPEYTEAVRVNGQLGGIPVEGDFLPIEENTGPDSTPVEDMRSRWAFERGGVNPRSDLEELESIHNEQAAGFSSSVDAGAFAEAAREYYEAYLEYWHENAPEYASQVLEPWMENVIRPALEA